GPMVNATTLDPRLVFSVQNGVGKDDLLVQRFGRDRVVGCAAMVGGTLHGPGRVAYTFSGLTYLGDVAGGPTGGAVDIAALIDETGVLGAEVRDDIDSVVWSKAVLAVGAMGAVGLARAVYHRVFLDDDLAELFLDLIYEAAAVAAAEGVPLVDLPGPLQIATVASAPRSEGREVLRAVGEQLVAAGQTAVRVSVLQSIERGRRTEVDAIHAEVLARAERHGIDTPVLRTTTRVLRAVDAANLEEES
ncbi:MAG TPA: ketopantoate reductase C-terminal domain-containing protein, partial [Acidimicrobiia bacterium]|nr:ketopantoate reductase C-terminal domain-containing protein [Acidimicrobiia bacterium]